MQQFRSVVISTIGISVLINANIFSILFFLQVGRIEGPADCQMFSPNVEPCP